MSKSVNARSTPLHVQRLPNRVRLYRKKQPVFSHQFQKIISLDQLSRSSHSFRQSGQSRSDAEGREMSTIQTSALKQETGCDGPRQDGRPPSYLQAHPIFRSTKRTVREILAELRNVWPKTQICENDEDRVTAEQRNIQPLLLTGSRKRVMRMENQVPSKRCRQVAQKNDKVHRQEFAQDIFFLPDLRVHPRRSSPEVDLEIGTESNLTQPQRLNYENGENRVTVGQRKILECGLLPEVLKENRVRSQGSQQSVQKDCRRNYLSVPTVSEVLTNGRLIRQPGMNIPRVMIRPHPTTQHNFQRPSQMVSPIESRVIGNISSVHPQNQRNRTDFIEREVVPRMNLGIPESCCLISAADGKLKNEASPPISTDSWPSGHGITSVISPKTQQYMERYLDRWATEPTFLEEVRSIASTLSQKGLFNIGTSSQAEPQSNSASLLPPEYNLRYSPIS